MLRGSFGHGLRSVSCITRQRFCEGCPLLDSCQYPALFAPQPGAELAAQFPDIPAPYVIEVPLGTPHTLAEGESLTFNMVLFGHAVRQLGTVILAWQRAAWNGLGKGQARATLARVEWEATPRDWTEVFSTDSGRVAPHAGTLILSEEAYFAGKSATSSVTLHLETPTRLQHRGTLCNSHQLTPEIVLGALRRKVALYARRYLGSMPAEPVRPDDMMLDHRTTVHQWQRYSSRQQRAMSMDGLVGPLTLKGELQSWLPWLWLGQYTHLGKNTSFGLGGYRLEASP
jgi:hypothetical protein